MVPTADVGVGLPPGAAPDDPAVRPRDQRCATTTAAVANMVAARERLRAVFADAGDRPRPSPGRSTSCARVRRCTTAALCACTPTPSSGCSTAWNRIHDAPNVVVADSSCFTTGPEKNPTLTAMAIAGSGGRPAGHRVPGGCGAMTPTTPAAGLDRHTGVQLSRVPRRDARQRDGPDVRGLGACRGRRRLD